MTTINNSKLRIGNFSSSEIVSLLSMGKRDMTPEELALRPKKGAGSKTTTIDDPNSFGDAALTYIEECNMERRLCQSISEDSNARPLSWGNLAEKYVFEKKLETAYTLMGDMTLVHPEFEAWVGSPDCTREAKILKGTNAQNSHIDIERIVSDVKAPYTRKSFCTLVKPVYELGLTGMDAMNWIRENHKDGEKYYVQILSNAILTNSQYGELIVFMPHKSELQEIRDLTQNVEDTESYRYFWIANGNDEELPHILDGGFYKDVTKILFEIPQADKDFLTHRVKLASTMLIERTEKLPVEA